MGKIKKGKASSGKNLKTVPNRGQGGKRFKQLRQTRKKGRRSFSDSLFSSSYLPETSTPVTKNSKKTRMKQKKREREERQKKKKVKELPVPALLYKFRNDHMLVNSDPPGDLPGLSVQATGFQSETEERMMDTIVIDD